MVEILAMALNRGINFLLNSPYLTGQLENCFPSIGDRLCLTGTSISVFTVRSATAESTGISAPACSV